MQFNYKDSDKIEYIFDFSTKNKKEMTDIIWNMYDIYNTKIKKIISEKILNENTYKQAEVIQISDFQKKQKHQNKQNTKNMELEKAIVIPFPKKSKESEIEYNYIFDTLDEVFRLIRDFRKNALSLVVRKKYTSSDLSHLVELVEGREKVLKYSFLEGNVDENIKNDMKRDFIELKDKICKERDRFDSSLIDYFLFKYYGVIKSSPYLKNKKEFCNNLENYFVTLNTELIKLKIFEHIKKQNKSNKKVTIKEFTPVLGEIDRLKIYIEKHLMNKNDSFYSQFQGVNILMKKLFFS